jgi:hypothetical protein
MLASLVAFGVVKIIVSLIVLCLYGDYFFCEHVRIVSDGLIKSLDIGQGGVVRSDFINGFSLCRYKLLNVDAEFACVMEWAVTSLQLQLSVFCRHNFKILGNNR